MKAAFLEAFRQPLVVRETQTPDLGPDDALIRVMACGVCRSDWHRWYGDLGWMGLSRDLPLVLGHEQAGIVERVGANVSSVHVGQRVLTPFHNGCGDRCRYCTAGLSNLCERPAVLTRTGGFAEYSRIANADFNAIPLPDDVSFEAGAAMGCRYMTAYHAVADRGEVTGGDWVAVHGCGGIGLSAIQVASALGAQVIAIDVGEEKLAQARAQGARYAVDASDGDVAAQIKDITSGGADVSMTEIQFRGSMGNPNHLYRPLLNLVRDGKLSPQALVGERISLGDVSRVFDAMTSFQTFGFTTITDFSG